MPNYNAPRNKIVLTGKQKLYLINNFPNTRNEILVEKLGISLRSVIRIARSLGLQKTSRFMKRAQEKAAEKARKSHLIHGTYPKKGVYSENLQKGVKYQFQPGHKEDRRKTRSRVAKSTATRNQTIKLERARISFGLPQRTKLKLNRQPRQADHIRCVLRKLGYTVPRGSRVAYYDENTNRNNVYETRKYGDRGYIYFDFKPLSEKAS